MRYDLAQMWCIFNYKKDLFRNVREKWWSIWIVSSEKLWRLSYVFLFLSVRTWQTFLRSFHFRKGPMELFLSVRKRQIRCWYRIREEEIHERVIGLCAIRKKSCCTHLIFIKIKTQQKQTHQIFRFALYTKFTPS